MKNYSRFNCDVKYTRRRNQDLKLQYWDDIIYCKKILSIIMMVPCKNPPGYNGDVIYSIVFEFGEEVTIVDCMGNMKLHVSNTVK